MGGGGGEREQRAVERKKERKKEIFKFFILQIKTHSTLIKSLYWDVIINNIYRVRK